MIQCIKCGMQNADGSKFCRFCGVALLHSSGNSQRPPYSWQSEEFKANERPRDADPRHTRVMTPPPTAQAPPQYAQNAPQRVQPLGQTSLYNQHNQPAAQQTQLQYNPYGHLYCPSCRTYVIPRVERKISQAGWIVFAVLMVGFFPLFWIGLLIREDRRFCNFCNTPIG